MSSQVVYYDLTRPRLPERRGLEARYINIGLSAEEASTRAQDDLARPPVEAEVTFGRRSKFLLDTVTHTLEQREVIVSRSPSGLLVSPPSYKRDDVWETVKAVLARVEVTGIELVHHPSRMRRQRHNPLNLFRSL